MFKFKGLIVLLVVATATLLSLGILFAQGDSASDQPIGNQIKTHDDLLVDVGQRVPEFGGMYRDPTTDRLVVFVKSGSKASQTSVEVSIEEVFGASIIPQGGLQLVEGQYTISQLKSWYDTVWDAVWVIPDVDSTDLAEHKNKLWVGVLATDTIPLVRELVLKTGIPLEAVEIEVTTPATLTSHSVREWERPLEGGWQESNSDNSKVCTLGFVTIRTDVEGVVMNSHCTNTWGGVDNAPYFQNVYSSSNRIGVETLDPSFWSGGSCPAGRVCRYSDSAFIDLDDNVTYDGGRIARTSLNSIYIDHSKPNFRIKGDSGSFASGDTVGKVGRSTGWTSGTILQTCAARDVTNPDGSDTGKTLLCQINTTIPVQGGDSGSPLFKVIDSPAVGDVELFGIEWGQNGAGGSWHSSIGFVYYELGSSATWYSCDPYFGC